MQITPCLLFDREAEEAAKFYVSVFKNSKITETSYYGESAPMPAGTVLMVGFELNGNGFQALNCGTQFKFNEAISLSVDCKSQEEVDYFWDKLTADGGAPGQCSWLKDKFGVSWQIVPADIGKLVQDSRDGQADRVTQAILSMRKIDVAALKPATR